MIVGGFAKQGVAGCVVEYALWRRWRRTGQHIHIGWILADQGLALFLVAGQRV